MRSCQWELLLPKAIKWQCYVAEVSFPLSELLHGGTCIVRLYMQFEIVESLFHVMAFRAPMHLVEGGLFLFCFGDEAGGGLILLLCIEKLWKTKYFMRSVVRHLYRINGNNVEKATSSISLVIKLRQNASDCPCATECLNCGFCRMNQSLRIPLKRHGCLRHIHGQRTGMYWCWCGNNADPAMDYIKCGKIRFQDYLCLMYVS